MQKIFITIKCFKTGSYILYISIFSILAFAFTCPAIKYRILLIPVAHAAVSLEALPDANSHGDFVVGPGKIEIELAPGESTTVDLTISNRLGTEKTFTIKEEDFTGSSDPNETVVLLGDDRGPYSLKDYIHPEAKTVDISNGFRARIPVTISIPANAQPGGLYGSLVVGTATKTGSTDSSNNAVPTNAIVTRIGTLFFIRVKGPVNENGHLTDFILAGNKKVLWEPQTVLFDILYKNEGNVSVNPYGNITISNMLGSSIGTIQVDPWFAMPQSLRFREVQWKTPFLFGFYTAHAVINRGYGSTTDEMNYSFWAIPWKIILLVLIALTIIISGFKWILSKVSFSIKK